MLQVVVNALAHHRLTPSELPAPLARVVLSGDSVSQGIETTTLPAFAVADVVEMLASRDRTVSLIDDAHALDDASEIVLRTVLESSTALAVVRAVWPPDLGGSDAWRPRLSSRWPLRCAVQTTEASIR